MSEPDAARLLRKYQVGIIHIHRLLGPEDAPLPPHPEELRMARATAGTLAREAGEPDHRLAAWVEKELEP